MTDDNDSKAVLTMKISDALEASGYFDKMNAFFKEQVAMMPEDTFDPSLVFVGYLTIVSRVMVYQIIKLAGIMGEKERIDELVNTMTAIFETITKDIAGAPASDKLYKAVVESSAKIRSVVTPVTETRH